MTRLLWRLRRLMKLTPASKWNLLWKAASTLVIFCQACLEVLIYLVGSVKRQLSWIGSLATAWLSRQLRMSKVCSTLLLPCVRRKLNGCLRMLRKLKSLLFNRRW